MRKGSLWLWNIAFMTGLVSGDVDIFKRPLSCIIVIEVGAILWVVVESCYTEEES